MKRGLISAVRIAAACGLFAGSGLAMAQSNGIVLSGPLNHGVADNEFGTSMNIVTSQFDDSGPLGDGWDFNFWDNGIGFSFFAAGLNPGSLVVDADGNVAALHPGDTIGPASTFAKTTNPLTAAEWLSGTDAYAGMMFHCDGRLANPVAGGLCYGYLHVTTTGPTGFPGMVDDTGFDGDGNAIVIPSADGTNGIIHVDVNHLVHDNFFGSSLNVVTGAVDDNGSISGNYDVNISDTGQDMQVWPLNAYSAAIVVNANGLAAALHDGDTVGPDSTFQDFPSGTVAEWTNGTDAALGVRFHCDGRLPNPVASGICYGYVQLRTTGTLAFPVTIVDTRFDGDGNAVAVSGLGSLAPPVATITPAALAVSLIAGENETASATLTIANAEGGQSLAYTIATGSDCSGTALPWLAASPASGSVGGNGVDAQITVTASPTPGSLPPGTYPAAVCISTNDPDQALVQIPLTLTVTAPTTTSSCADGIGDDVFCDGFDGASTVVAVPGAYTDRSAFVGGVAAGYYENTFDDLGSSVVPEPPRDYSDSASGIAYTISSYPNLDNLWFYPGFMSVGNSIDHLVVTFTGVPVTAVGGDFFADSGGDGGVIPNQAITITLTLADGTSQTFSTISAGQDDFRGFTSSQPIVSLSIDAPIPGDQIDFNWSAMDDLIVGTAN
jgi:hypothetical protein